MDQSSLVNSSCPDYLDDDIKQEIPCEDMIDPISAVFIRSEPFEFSTEISNNDKLMVCRACLSKTTLRPTESLSRVYAQVTGLSLNDERLPRNLCRRCIAYVRKFERFRRASRKNDRVLKDLVNKGMLNERSILTIQKQYENLFPNLSVIHFSPNEYTISLIDNKNDIIKSEVVDWKDDMFSNDNDIDSDTTNDILRNTTENHDITYLDLKTDLSETLDSKSDLKLKKESNKKNKIKKKRIKRSSTKDTEMVEELNLVKDSEIDNEDIILSATESDEDQPLILLNEKNLKTKLQKRKKLKKTDKLTIDKKTRNRQDSSFEEYFSIEVLSLEQQKEEFAKRKLSENYINSKLRCEFCFKGFLHERTFNMHMAKHTKRMGEFTCVICHKHCTAQRALRHHVDGFHKYKYTCRQCDYQTKTRCTARLHIDYHNGKRYKCEKCDQEFSRQSSLMSHRRVKHATDAVCALCGYSYLGEKGLLFHRNFKHKLDDLNVPPNGPVCIECDIIFSNEEALATHRKVSPRHGICRRNEPPAVPPRRQKSTQDRPRLIKRPRKDIPPTDLETSETDNQRVNCEQCGILVNSAKEYCVHFNKMHSNCTRTQFPEGSKTRLCAICGKNFQNPSMLSIHTSDCHSQVPAKHKCVTCGKAFKHRGNLTIHMNIHLGRRFPCPICGKMFNQAFNRDRHYTYVHTSIKDVKCDYCDKCFKSDNEKKLHTNYVHFKKPYQKRCRGRKQPDCLPPGKKRREDFSEIPEIGWNRDCDSEVAKEY